MSIKDLNDAFRKDPIRLGRAVHTRGIAAMGQDFVLAAYRTVAAFDAFDGDNDPYGEHDFGKLAVAGTDIYFKIDCYDPTGEYGSEDPSDPAKTLRTLTLLLPEEY